MLADLHLGDGNNLGTADGRIALDCSIRETRIPGVFSISTTDFFFPLVDSPYTQGRIGAANVLSDLYAEGVSQCDFVLMLLAACRDMEPAERTICTQEMVRGFRDACTLAGTTVTGGQTVLNPWPIIGGVATSIVQSHDFIPSDGAQVGDIVVLTKPLGTQVAVNVHQWKCQHQKESNGNRHWKQIMDDQVITEQVAEDMMHQAVCSMARLNKNGAFLMQKYQATSGTDVTGFGILGHAQNLMENQKAAVGMELHTLPCLEGAVAVNDQVMNFRLTTGFSAETSGGLLITLPSQEAAEAFCQEIQQLDDAFAWIVGKVVAHEKRKATIVENVNLLSV